MLPELTSRSTTGADRFLPYANVDERSLSHRAESKASSANALLPTWVWLVSALFALWGTFTTNPTLTPAAIVILLVCAQLLCRQGEPPVLVFACGMQWLQAAGLIFYTNYYGISVAQAGAGLPIETATWLSLGAILTLALGMRAALVRCAWSQHQELLADGLRVDILQAFLAYLATFVIASIAGVVAFAVPAVTQVIYALITLKWMAVFILAYCVMEQRNGYGLLAIVVLLEFGVGVLGYFAGFKSVFFVLLVVVLSAPRVLHGKRLLMTALIAFVLFSTGVVWSAIKAEYREFQNQGMEQQVVGVTMGESAAKLGDLLSNFTWSEVGDGLEAMALRVSYVQYFGLTLVNVPDSVPYENGALWLGALKHVVTPRLFFPGKAAISDSARTSLYTGVTVAGEETGTSIGIGYVGESYIDFGPVFMFVPIFLLGVFYGLIYRLFAIRSQSKLIGVAIASAILIFGAYTIETSNIKLVGGNLTAVLVIGVCYLSFRRPFMAWLTQQPA